ncbi:hypothetical protein [Helicobacter sp.]|nr:hypothetical protein [Helicobacter sp.]
MQGNCHRSLPCGKILALKGAKMIATKFILVAIILLCIIAVKAY